MCRVFFLLFQTLTSRSVMMRKDGTRGPPEIGTKIRIALMVCRFAVLRFCVLPRVLR